MFLWKTVFLISFFFITFSSSLFISCLMFVFSSMVVSMSFLMMNLNWLMYTMIILYLGGMMILFMYMCSISSVSKIESNSMTGYFMVFFVSLISYYFFPALESFSLVGHLGAVYSLFLNSSEVVLIMLSVYLIIGLFASIFFIEKLEGPLKSFYVK